MAIGIIASVDGLDAALQAIFGAPAEDIHVSHLDHLCGTLTPALVEQLLTAVGGPWAAILERITERRAHAAVAKDPGPDPRLKPEKKSE